MVHRLVHYLCLRKSHKQHIVVLRMVVFRPFTSEVIVAKVKSSDEDGIRCLSSPRNTSISLMAGNSDHGLLRRPFHPDSISSSTICVVRLKYTYFSTSCFYFFQKVTQTSVLTSGYLIHH